MKLIAVLLVTLMGCASTVALRADYVKAGADSKQVRADKNLCATESMRVWHETAADPSLSSYFMQKHFLGCMKEKGYAPVGIHPNAFKQTL
jgi:hypothetical protein